MLSFLQLFDLINFQSILGGRSELLERLMWPEKLFKKTKIHCCTQTVPFSRNSKNYQTSNKIPQRVPFIIGTFPTFIYRSERCMRIGSFRSSWKVFTKWNGNNLSETSTKKVRPIYQRINYGSLLIKGIQFDLAGKDAIPLDCFYLFPQRYFESFVWLFRCWR